MKDWGEKKKKKDLEWVFSLSFVRPIGPASCIPSSVGLSSMNSKTQPSSLSVHLQLALYPPAQHLSAGPVNATESSRAKSVFDPQIDGLVISNF